MGKYPSTRDFMDQLARQIAENEGQPQPVSDYRLAQILKLTRSALSNFRTGKTSFGIETCEKVAELLGLDPLYVISCIQAERTQIVAQRQLWQRNADAWKKVMQVAALALALGSTLPTGTTQADLSKIYIMRSRRRPRPRRLRLQFAAGHV